MEKLPVEVRLRAVPSGHGNDCYEIAGTIIECPRMMVEVLDMRGAVLGRMPVSELPGWVSENRYRYVPGTRVAYHREPIFP